MNLSRYSVSAWGLLCRLCLFACWFSALTVAHADDSGTLFWWDKSNAGTPLNTMQGYSIRANLVYSRFLPQGAIIAIRWKNRAGSTYDINYNVTAGQSHVFSESVTGLNMSFPWTLTASAKPGQALSFACNSTFTMAGEKSEEWWNGWFYYGQSPSRSYIWSVYVGLPPTKFPFSVLNEFGGSHSVDLWVDGVKVASQGVSGAPGTLTKGFISAEVDPAAASWGIGVDGGQPGFAASTSVIYQTDPPYLPPTVIIPYVLNPSQPPEIGPTSDTPSPDPAPFTPDQGGSAAAAGSTGGDTMLTGTGAGLTKSGTGGISMGTTAQDLMKDSEKAVDKFKNAIDDDGVPKGIPRNAPGDSGIGDAAGPSLMRFDVKWGPGPNDHKEVSLDPLDYPSLAAALAWFKRLFVRVSAALFIAWVYHVITGLISSYGATHQPSVMSPLSEVVPGVATALSLVRSGLTLALCAASVAVAFSLPVLVSTWYNFHVGAVGADVVSGAGFGASVEYAAHLLSCVLPVSHVVALIVNYVWVRMAKMWAVSITVGLVKMVPGN